MSSSASAASGEVSIAMPGHNDLKGDLSRTGVTLSWEQLSYAITVKKDKEVAERALLHKVSGIVAPGQIVSIMGASGAGKTTLLNVLAGRIGAGTLSGKVLVNGAPRNIQTWKSLVAYVEQDDLMYQNLTVRETLQYAAYLRLPPSMSRAEKDDRVDKIITELGLVKCKDTRIGGAGNRGISGGERKRVSIGIELVTNPRLLFLDEPTSGLDAFTAANIIESIKHIAVKDNCTVLMTIHQPREYILNLFDKVVLLSEGKMVFTGSVPLAVAHFEKCGFKCPANTNPSDFFLDTMTIDFRSEDLKQKSLERIKLLQDSWKDAPKEDIEVKHTSDILNSFGDGSNKKALEVRAKNNPFVELWILLGRNLKDLSRDPATIGATIGQSIINMLILGFVFWQMDTSLAGIQNRIGAFFFICINMTFGNVMPTIAIFTLQREIIKRERASGSYRASSAFIAKIISQIPVTTISVLLFTLPVYWMLGLQNDVEKYFIFVCVIWVHAITATIMGIMVSSGVPSVQVGQIVGPLVIVVFIVFGGQLANLDSIPKALSWIKWVSIIYHSYSALVENEFTGLVFGCPGPRCTTGENAIREYGLDALALWYNVLVNVGICLFFLVVGYLLFRWKSRPLMRLN